jgi:hypothetical protein
MVETRFGVELVTPAIKDLQRKKREWEAFLRQPIRHVGFRES